MVRFGLLVAAAVLVVDQASKYLIVEGLLRPDGVTQTPFFTDTVIELLPVFNLIMAWNRGVSFSLFSAESAVGQWVLVGVQLAITAGLVWWMRKLDTRMLVVGAGMIVGGALGNIIDRVRFGAVADFFDFHVGGWHFATFNVADACITLGVAAWLLDAFVRRPHHPPPTVNGSPHA
ncbi:MAG: signal peptidase II [Rhodospirillaceae bacterium]|nr:signal peptidase II [Rhodospirillaceae bacterium]